MNAQTSSKEIDLLRRLRLSDSEVLRLIVEQHITRLTQFASSMLRSPDAVDDVVQGVFVWLWENRESLDIRGGLRPYLLRAVRNRILDHRKAELIRKKHTIEAEQPDVYSIYYGRSYTHSPEDEILTNDAIAIALARLSERRQLALRLRLNDGLEYAEIGEILGVSSETATRLINRALTELKEILREVSE